MRNPGAGRPAPAPLVLAIAVAVISGCSGAGPSRSGALPSAAGSPAGGASASADPLTELAAAATEEGALTTIGLDPDRCGYREALDTFGERYAIEINELDPGASSTDQLAAVGTERSGPGAPDVVELLPDVAPSAAETGKLAPYRVTTWDTIPETLRDADGRWAAGYSGAIAFETNLGGDADPPSDWSSLLEGSRRDQVALAGDPHVSDDAIAAVYAAALGNGGSLDDAQAGLDFFADLAERGSLLRRVATSASIVRGATPIAIRWTWDALAHQDAVNGNPEVDVAIPRTGRLGGVRVQAISAFAPHPNAARLWLEYLFSDEGQNLWLRHHCVPARITDMTDQGAIPPDVQAEAPDLGEIVMPSPEQWSEARSLITGQWDAIVGVDIH